MPMPGVYAVYKNAFETFCNKKRKPAPS